MARPWYWLAALLVVLGAVLAFDAAEERKKISLREQERLISLAGVLKTNLGAQLLASSRMLDVLRQDIPELLQTANGSERLNRRMALLSESLIGIRTLLLVGADGIVRASNRSQLVGQNFKDSETYQTIRIGSDPAALYVAAPFRTPLGLFTSSLGKVFTNPAGEYDGYLLAVLDPDYFGVLMQSLQYVEDMRLSVAHGDGKIIFSTQREPDIRGFDLSQKPDSLFNRHRQSGRESSFVIDRATATADLRLIAIQTVWPKAAGADKALIVAVSRQSEAVFAEWEKHNQQQAILFAGVVLAVCLGYYLYTHRRQAYQLLRLERARVEQAEERIRDSDEQFRGYFENMAVGALQLDAAGRYQLVNDRYCEMTGYRREELQQLRPDELSPPEERSREEARMREFLASNDGKHFTLEKRMLRKNGQIIWVHVSANVVRDEQGRVRFTTAVVEDITPRKQLMAELECARVAADMANRAKSLFLGNMSHEMRTPLHQIAGMAEMLHSEPLSDKQARRLSILEAATRRLDTVIGGILTLVDIESGSAGIKLAPLDLGQVVGDVVDAVAERAAGKNLGLRREIGPLPSPLMGDVAHLTTILSCYCNNAIAFSERGEIVVRAALIEEDAGSVVVRLSVEDQGIGIDSAQIERLFEHFEQADNSHTRRYGGTGVGLAIVRSLARLMGGDAGCRSVLGEGSSFWVTIRLVKIVTPEAGSEPLDPQDPDDFQI